MVDYDGEFPLIIPALITADFILKLNGKRGLMYQTVKGLAYTAGITALAVLNCPVAKEFCHWGFDGNSAAPTDAMNNMLIEKLKSSTILKTKLFHYYL